jgi:hypothetical protein
MIPLDEEIRMKSFTKGNQKILDSLFHDYLSSSVFQSSVDELQAEYIGQTLQNACTAHDTGQTSTIRPVKGVIYSWNKDLLSVTEMVIRKLKLENVAELYKSSSIRDISSELERFWDGERVYGTCPVCGYVNKPNSHQCAQRLSQVWSPATYDYYLIKPE